MAAKLSPTTDAAGTSSASGDPELMSAGNVRSDVRKHYDSERSSGAAAGDRSDRRSTDRAFEAAFRAFEADRRHQEKRGAAARRPREGSKSARSVPSPMRRERTRSRNVEAAASRDHRPSDCRAFGGSGLGGGYARDEFPQCETIAAGVMPQHFLTDAHLESHRGFEVAAVRTPTEENRRHQRWNSLVR